MIILLMIFFFRNLMSSSAKQIKNYVVLSARVKQQLVDVELASQVESLCKKFRSFIIMCIEHTHKFDSVLFITLCPCRKLNKKIPQRTSFDSLRLVETKKTFEKYVIICLNLCFRPFIESAREEEHF